MTQSIHRMLASRLAIVAIILCFVFAAIVSVTNQQRIEDEVVELARIRLDQFEYFISDVLSNSGDLDATVLEERLRQFVQRTGSVELNDGRFVFVRIYDNGGNKLIESVEDKFESVVAVRAALDAANIVSLAAGQYEVATTQLDGRPFVAVAVPLMNSTGQLRGQVVALFRVSDRAIAAIRTDIFQTMAYVLGLVLITMLAIYPVIRRLLNRLSQQTVRLLDSNLEILQVLGSAIAKRDSDTDAHNYRVSVYSVRLAESMQLPRVQIQGLIKGALLHDVGKLGIRDNILLKPGKLNEAEFETMKTHVDHGLEITDRAAWLKDAQAVVGGHHEKFDGAGYPAGLKGDEIPIVARMFAITDVFDALTSRRPYKEPLSFEDAMEILESGRGSHFDPELLDYFRGIARELYEGYADGDDDKPRRHLEVITSLYFKKDVGDLLA